MPGENTDLTFEGRKLLYGQCAELHRYFLTWRHQLLAGYVATLTGLGLAYGWTFSEGNNARGLAWVVCAMGVFFTTIFWLLDMRNRDLYRACINSAAEIEKQLDPEDKIKTGAYLALKSPPSSELITHSTVIDILFGGAIIGMIAGAIVSYCKLHN